MKRDIEYRITLEEAQKIAEDYCKQHGYSYEKLMTFKTKREFITTFHIIKH